MWRIIDGNNVDRPLPRVSLEREFYVQYGEVDDIVDAGGEDIDEEVNIEFGI